MSLSARFLDKETELTNVSSVYCSQMVGHTKCGVLFIFQGGED